MGKISRVKGPSISAGASEIPIRRPQLGGASTSDGDNSNQSSAKQGGSDSGETHDRPQHVPTTENRSERDHEENSSARSTDGDGQGTVGRKSSKGNKKKSKKSQVDTDEDDLFDDL